MRERLEGVDTSFDDGNARGWVSKRFPALSEALSRMRCGSSYAFPLSSAQKGELMVLIWPEMTERANCGCSIRSAVAKESIQEIWQLRSSKLSRPS
jgi:hypothetical protein